jgi:hypothetical protein
LPIINDAIRKELEKTWSTLACEYPEKIWKFQAVNEINSGFISEIRIPDHNE